MLKLPNIVFVFSYDHRKSQENMESMLMQNLGGGGGGGATKSIMVFSEVNYWPLTIFYKNKSVGAANMSVELLSLIYAVFRY